MRRILSLAVHAILAFGFAMLLAWTFPSLAGRLNSTSYPFRYIVRLNDTLALVEQSSDDEAWVVLNSERKRVESIACKCPLEAGSTLGLPQLEQQSNLEMIELKSLSPTTFRLKAHRDDLGSPEIGYAYTCDEAGIRPQLRYESFFGFVYPILSWRYFASIIGVWLLLVLGIGRLRRKSN